MFATIWGKSNVQITRDYQEAIEESVAVLEENSVRLTVGPFKSDVPRLIYIFNMNNMAKHRHNLGSWSWGEVGRVRHLEKSRVYRRKVRM